MSEEQQFRLDSVLYVLSFAVLAAWLVLLLVGFAMPDVMAFANRIALPTLLGSIACIEVFKRLARRAEKKVLAQNSRGQG